MEREVDFNDTHFFDVWCDVLCGEDVMITDKEFFQWIHDRLIAIYGEDENSDYMYKLRTIIKATPEDQITPNVAEILVKPV